MTTTIGPGGKVAIPKAICELAGLREGSEIEIEFRGGKIEIQAKTAVVTLKRVGKRVEMAAPPDARLSREELEAVSRSLRERMGRKRSVKRR